MPSLQDLPDDVWLHMAAGLEASSLQSLQAVCRRWNKIALGDDLLALWLWQRGWAHHTAYSPNLIRSIAARLPMPSMSVAERLCTWAGQKLEQGGQHAELVLGLAADLLQWLVAGLVQQHHGFALLKWMLEHEESHLQDHEDAPRRLLGCAITAACQGGKAETMEALLSSTKGDVLQLAGVDKLAVVTVAAKGGHAKVLSYLLQRLQEVHGPAPTAAFVTAAGLSAAQAGRRQVLDMLQRDWDLKPHSEACKAAAAAAATHGQLHVLPSLLGCTCAWATALTASSEPVMGAGSEAQGPTPPPLLVAAGAPKPPGAAGAGVPAAGVPAAAAAAAAEEAGQSTTAAKAVKAARIHRSKSPLWVAAPSCPALSHPLPSSTLALVLDAQVPRNLRLPICNLLLAHQQLLPEEAYQLVWKAASLGWVKMLELLLVHPHSPCFKTGAAADALRAAMESKTITNSERLQVLQLLLSRDDVSSGYTSALHSALRGHHIQALQYLLDHAPAALQADTTEWQRTLSGALLGAVCSKHIEFVDILLRHGADAAWQNGMCLEPAIRKSKVPVLRLLLERGAIRSASVWGQAMQQAADLQNEAIMSLLVHQAILLSTTPSMTPSNTGGSANQRPALNMPLTSLQEYLAAALQDGAQAGQLKGIQLVLAGWQDLREQAEQTQALLAQDIYLQATAVAEALGNALVQAAKRGHAHVCTWLMERLQDTDVPMLDRQARTEQLKNAVTMPVVHAAAAAGHTAVLKQLLSVGLEQLLGTEPDGSLEEGLLAAVLAAGRNGHRWCVRALLSAGADPNASTLLTAVKEGSVVLAQTLLLAACYQAGLSLEDAESMQQRHQLELWPSWVLDDALCAAAEAGSEWCVQLLVQSWGACVDAYHGAPMQAALRHGATTGFRAVRQLLTLGADYSGAPKDVLQWLVAKGWVEPAPLQKGQGVYSSAVLEEQQPQLHVQQQANHPHHVAPRQLVCPGAPDPRRTLRLKMLASCGQAPEMLHGRSPANPPSKPAGGLATLQNPLRRQPVMQQDLAVPGCGRPGDWGDFPGFHRPG